MHHCDAIGSGRVRRRTAATHGCSVLRQALAKQEAELATCEQRLAALPYDAEAAARLEATVAVEQAAVQAASDRVNALASQLTGEDVCRSLICVLTSLSNCVQDGCVYAVQA